MIRTRIGRLSDRNYPGACQTDRLLDRSPIMDHVADLDDHLVLQTGGVRQLLDARQIGSGHAPGNSNGNAGGAGGGDTDAFGAGRPPDRLGRAEMQLVDFDELGKDALDHLHRLRHDDGCAERGHGAGDVDHAPQAQARSDGGAVRAHGGGTLASESTGCSGTWSRRRIASSRERKAFKRSCLGFSSTLAGLSLMTILPASMNTTRSLTSPAKLISCVTNSMVMPSLASLRTTARTSPTSS